MKRDSDQAAAARTPEDEVVKLVRAASKAAFCSWWKRKYRKRFSWAAASERWKEWVTLGGYSYVFHLALNAAIQGTQDENLIIPRMVAMLKSIPDFLSRPVGRPRKHVRRFGGIITGRMDPRKIERERIRQLKAPLLPFVDGAKHGAFINRYFEDNSYLTGYKKKRSDPKWAREFVELMGKQQAVEKESNSRALREFIEYYDLDPRLEPRLKKDLERQIKRQLKSKGP